MQEIKCLVLGGAGFIGSAVVDLLVDHSYQVSVIDNFSTGKTKNKNPRANYFVESILNFNELNSLLRKINPHYIFHLAALPRIQPSFSDPIIHDDVNVRGCINLITACKDLQNLEGIIYSSSSSVYGDPINYPTTESEMISPLSPYALQKYAGERYMHILGSKAGIKVASLRYFNVYGPRSYDELSEFNAYSSVVGIFNEQANKGGPVSICGDGMQERDFIHVWDVARANLTLALNMNVAQDQVFNVGTGSKWSVIEVAKLFNASIEFIPARHGEARVTHADSSKLKGLGWKPEISLQDAIFKGLI